jgi:ribosomal protein L22
MKKVTKKRKRSGKKKINKVTNEIDGQDVNRAEKYIKMAKQARKFVTRAVK